MLRRPVLLLLPVLLAACGAKRSADSAAAVALTVACAASLRPALEEAAAAFQKAHPDIRITAAYGASGTLFAQLSQRAPFDVFLSADTDYPRKLVAAGHAGEAFTFATGRLALWVPQGSPLQPEKDGLRCLTEASVQRITIANPALAPYGRAAEEALRHAGIYDAVKDKLVPAGNVAEAAQYVQSGAAQAGLVALSVTLAPAMQSGGRSWTVPAAHHQPLEHGGVLLHHSRQPEAARRFRDWLLSPAGQTILARHGFPPRSSQASAS